MTTVLADYRLGLMCADSNQTDDDRVWLVKKIHRINGALVGQAGTQLEMGYFLDWFRAGMNEPPDFNYEDCAALVLDHDGLWMFDTNCDTIKKVPSGREAIGSGGKGAICAYEALGWSDPARAVRIACHHDSNSRPPVRTHRLKRTA